MGYSIFLNPRCSVTAGIDGNPPQRSIEMNSADLTFKPEAAKHTHTLYREGYQYTTKENTIYG